MSATVLPKSALRKPSRCYWETRSNVKVSNFRPSPWILPRLTKAQKSEPVRNVMSQRVNSASGTWNTWKPGRNTTGVLESLAAEGVTASLAGQFRRDWELSHQSKAAAIAPFLNINWPVMEQVKLCPSKLYLFSDVSVTDWAFCCRRLSLWSVQSFRETPGTVTKPGASEWDRDWCQGRWGDSGWSVFQTVAPYWCYS